MKTLDQDVTVIDPREAESVVRDRSCARPLQEFFGLGDDPIPTGTRKEGLCAAFHTMPALPGEKPVNVGQDDW